ncbi:MAG: tetratricopeptide repeat protein [Leptolyngbya sp. SIO1D8]|nr:tetratricopeptide repeat protein [Leptolyngbya sp. SIO1D8]
MDGRDVDAKCMSAQSSCSGFTSLSSAFTLANVVSLYAALGQHETVLQILQNPDLPQQLLLSTPYQFTKILGQVAKAYAETEQHDHALQILEGVRPSDQDAVRRQLVELYANIGDFDRADAIIHQMTDVALQVQQTSQLVAQAVIAEQSEEAQGFLDQALHSPLTAQDPYHPALILAEVAAHLMAQQHPKGLEYLAQAQERLSTVELQNPHAPRVLLTMADGYIAAGERESARPLLDQVLQWVQSASVPYEGSPAVSTENTADYDFKALEFRVLVLRYASAGWFTRAIAIAENIPAEYCRFRETLFREMLLQAIEAKQLDAASDIFAQMQ